MKMTAKTHSHLPKPEPYQRLSAGTGGVAVSMNEAGDIQITIGFDTTTSTPPVDQQRHCSALVAVAMMLITRSFGMYTNFPSSLSITTYPLSSVSWRIPEVLVAPPDPLS
jgi:hypothetical protein